MIKIKRYKCEKCHKIFENKYLCVQHEKLHVDPGKPVSNKDIINALSYYIEKGNTDFLETDIDYVTWLELAANRLHYYAKKGKEEKDD